MTGEIAQQLRTLAVQQRGLEFRSQRPDDKCGRHRAVARFSCC